jgi:ubiquinone/menaquinone biosynthesis C-methylase UbiE
VADASEPLRHGSRELARALVSGAVKVRHWLLRQPFFTSTLLPAIPRPLRWALRQAYFAPIDLAERLAGGSRGELVPSRSQIFSGSVEGYRRSGDRFVEILAEVARLTPDAQILDVGSGNGRLAVALTAYLSPQGSYDGLEIVESGVRWCTENVTSAYPAFRFHKADVYNAEYNPNGRYRASEYRFPFEDASFDLVALMSVFTHMLAADVQHYVSEIYRVLKPRGRCFATFFLVNEESTRLMDDGESSMTFKHQIGAAWIANRAVPEMSVAYDEEFVLETFAAAGFTDVAVHLGGWCGRPPFWEPQSGPGDQDVVVCMKAVT